MSAPEIPAGCATCKGVPWLDTVIRGKVVGVHRCSCPSCPRGRWLAAKDAERRKGRAPKRKSLREDVADFKALAGGDKQ